MAIQQNHDSSHTCVYWAYNSTTESRYWSNDGVSTDLTNVDADKTITCHSTHLTSFAVLAVSIGSLVSLS